MRLPSSGQYPDSAGSARSADAMRLCERQNVTINVEVGR